MKKEELSLIIKSLKSMLGDLKIQYEAPYDSYGKEYSQKKFEEIKKEIVLCRKLIKKLL